jgi:hypothetical protein
MSTAKRKKKASREIPLADFGAPVDREPLVTCPVDRSHPPMIEQPGGSWRCRACGAARLPQLRR